MSNSKNKDSISISSLWYKIKNHLRSLFKSSEITQQEDKSGSQSGSSGSGGKSGKLKGQGFKDPKAATHVKDPETILYNELKKDPAAMQALKKLINHDQRHGQIPVSEIVSSFEIIKNSTQALQSIADSPFAPPEAKARARNELALKRLKKFQEQQGLTPEGPKPGLRK